MSELSENVRDQIIDALKQKNKIQAIKIYRDATGEDLKSSKDFIEILTRRINEESPGTIPEPSGCFGVVLLGVIAASVLIGKHLIS